MNATLPPGWRGRCLALSLLLVALAGLYVVAVAPLLDVYGDLAASVSARRTLVSKLHQISSELPELRNRLSRLRTPESSSSVMLHGTSDAVAAAELQGYIADLATNVGMSIGSTEILPSVVQGGYHRVGLRVLLSGSYESLLRFLGKLEAGTPPLVVDNLQIRSIQRQSGSASVAAHDSSLEVYGFRPEEAASATGR